MATNKLKKRTFANKGDKHGELTVIKEVAPKILSDGYEDRMILCSCSCGKKITTRLKQLRKNNGVKSCKNCAIESVVKKYVLSHGDSESRLYKIYKNMLRRCYSSNFSDYYKYGGRGIEICEEWKSSYIVFRKWAIENNYSDNLSIDRIDNNGNYEPNNCRWTTPSIQARNRRSNVTFNGECALDASHRLGGCKGLVDTRVRNGWSLEEAFNKAPRLIRK